MEQSRNEADSQRHNVVPCFFQVRRRAAPRAQGPNGPQGWGPSGPLGPFGAQRALGALGVIPKLFRVAGHYEWKVISIGTPCRMEGHLDTWDLTYYTDVLYWPIILAYYTGLLY